MASKAKRSRARTAQLRQRRVARQRKRQRKIEAQADLKPLGKKEDEKRRRRRFGAQQLRHDRRRRRGQANRDPGARLRSTFFGFKPAGGEGQRHATGTKMFTGLAGPSKHELTHFRGQRRLPAKRREKGQPVGRSGNKKRRDRRRRARAEAPRVERGHAHLGRGG